MAGRVPRRDRDMMRAAATRVRSPRSVRDSLLHALLPISGLVVVVALAPIGITYLGYGVMSKVAVVGVMTFAAMTVTAYKGLTAVEDSARQLLRSYAATPRAVVTKLLIPNSLPYVFAALKLSVSL